MLTTAAVQESTSSTLSVTLQAISTLVGALVLGFLALAKRWVKREVAAPARKVQKQLRKHTAQDEQYWRKVDRMLHEKELQES